MSKFEAGQKVRVIKSPTVSKDFKVGDIVVIAGGNPMKGHVHIKSLDGVVLGSMRDGDGWSEGRFEAYEEPMPALDLTKPVETQDGAVVTLITTEARGLYPVKGYINDCESLEGWTLEGKFFGNGSTSEYDLRNVVPRPMEREVYVNVYKDVDGSLDLGVSWASRSAADGGATSQRVACIKVKLVAGQYDE